MFTMKRKALKSLSIIAMSFGLCAYMPDPVIINESDFESSHINTNTPFTPIAINDGDSFLYNTTINDRLIFELQATSDMPEVNNVSFTFDNFTLQTYPENDQAFEIRNLTDNTLNITFVINGQNFITCGNSALSPIYLTSEGGAINVFFTLPNCSCDQYAEITIGTAMVSSEDIFVIERNNCPGSNKLLNCRANPGDNDNFLNVKPNPTQYYMISGYIHDYTEANLVEEDCTEPTCTESETMFIYALVVVLM
jgi:hypothetical protein